MIDAPINEQIPIRLEDGRLRVRQTRVLLDLIIYAFRLGSTPENITEQYLSLSLEDVYLALGYYLRHREAIDDHLQLQAVEADALRRAYEAAHPPRLTRELLLDRLHKRSDAI